MQMLMSTAAGADADRRIAKDVLWTKRVLAAPVLLLMPVFHPCPARHRQEEAVQVLAMLAA
jgi:hypothetical protein